MVSSPKAERQRPPAEEAERVPMIVFPRAQSGDWYDDARACIARYLPRHGSILFRGFDVDQQRLIATLGAEPLEHQRVAPWGQPAAIELVQCREPAGESSFVDLRELYRALPGATRARLVDRGLCYVQILGPERWRQLFACEQRAQVEAWCEKDDSSFEWLEDGRLRLTRREPAVTRRGGALCWSARTPAFLGAGPHSSREIRYGDGSPIERGLLADLEQSSARVRSVIGWECSDLLVLDRTLSASCNVLELAESPGFVSTRLTGASRPNG